MAWYLYIQNNNGGFFVSPALRVWVEADTAAEANARAVSAGVYFDGIAQGKDFGDNGNRWSPCSRPELQNEGPFAPVPAWLMQVMREDAAKFNCLPELILHADHERPPMPTLKIDDAFVPEALDEEPILEVQKPRTERVRIVHEFDSHILGRIRHGLRIAAEKFKENAEVMEANTASGGSAFVHARASERLAKEFREYVAECQAVADLLEENDRLIVAAYPEE